MSLSTARKYADALFVKSKGHYEKAVEDFASLHKVCQDNPRLRTFLEHPHVDIMEKKLLLSNMLSQLNVSEVFKAFLLILVANHRLDMIETIHEAFLDLVRHQLGIVRGELVHMATTTEDELASIKQKFATMLHSQVEWEERVDNSMIAGFRVRIEDTFYDASLSHQLSKVKQRLLDQTK